MLPMEINQNRNISRKAKSRKIDEEIFIFVKKSEYRASLKL